MVEEVGDRGRSWWRGQWPATRTPSTSWSPATGGRCSGTATGCSGPAATPRTPPRTRWNGPGVAWPATTDPGRSAAGCTGSRPMSASMPTARAGSSGRSGGPVELDLGGADIATRCSSAPADPQDEVLRNEEISLAFVAALQLLAPRQRAALLLHDVLGFSHGEVAEVLDIGTGAVNSLLSRARETVRGNTGNHSRRAPIRGCRSCCGATCGPGGWPTSTAWSGWSPRTWRCRCHRRPTDSTAATRWRRSSRP